MTTLATRSVALTRQQKQERINQPRFCSPSELAPPIDKAVAWELYGEELMEMRRQREGDWNYIPGA